MNKPRKLQSRLIKPDFKAPEPFGSLTTPIHHASTITFENVAAMRARDWLSDVGYDYGLHATPTTYELRHRIAELEGGLHSILSPSGLAAIALVNLALLRSGDQVMVPTNVYGPNRDLGVELLEGYGISSVSYDPMDVEATARSITPHTRLMWIEAPGSISMEVPDVPALTRLAKQHQITTALDNTWAAGIYFNGFEHGLDIVMQALTKYPSGGSDVLMGSVVTRDAALYQRLKIAHMRLGSGVSGDDCYLVLRGLTSLSARLAMHQTSGLKLAHWMSQQKEIATLLHPAYASCPGHENWQRDFSGSGGLFSVVFDGSIEAVKIDAMVDCLELFSIGYSWGGSHSLVIPYQMGRVRPKQTWDQGGLVRFYIGLEDTNDLINDLEQAFEVFRQ